MLSFKAIATNQSSFQTTKSQMKSKLRFQASRLSWGMLQTENFWWQTSYAHYIATWTTCLSKT